MSASKINYPAKTRQEAIEKAHTQAALWQAGGKYFAYDTYELAFDEALKRELKRMNPEAEKKNEFMQQQIGSDYLKNTSKYIGD